MQIPNELMEISQSKDFLREVDEAARKAKEFDALLERREQALSAPYYTMERFLDETGGGTGRFSPKAEISRSLAELREIPVLSKNISSRLIESGITPERWKSASPSDRLGIMDSAFRIMAEEMRVPQEVLSSMCILHSGTEEMVAGSCNLFVSRNEAGDIVLNPDVRPTVEMNYDLMYFDEINQPLRCLFHQAVVMMEQSCVTEGRLGTPAGAPWDAWASEVDGEINGTRPKVEGAMQQYARNAEEVFAACYEKLAQLRAIQGRQIHFKSN